MAGRYKILEELGVGGVGAVFKAYDTQLNRYVAVKRLLTREEAEKEDERTDTLVKEAGSLATLQHPNIVSIYDLANDDEGFFIVMELLEGDTLADWIRAGVMSLPDFHEFATQTLEAVLTAHHQSILHRDLKPENIKMIRLPGGRLQAKVLDFGLARMSYGARKMTEDQQGNVMGSIYYMAPEQLLRQPVDGRTDLYALGCLFYQVLSGYRPFEHETVQGIMDLHLQHLVHPLKTVAPRVPQPVSDWVMWLMNLDPNQRPANAQQALASLRELHQAGWLQDDAEQIPVAIPVVEVVTGSPRRTTSQALRPGPAGSQRLAGQPSQRITSGVRRPTSSTPRAATPGSSTSALRPGARPASKPKPQDEERVSLPKWIWPASAAVVILIAWSLWPSKGTPSEESSTTPAAAPPPATTSPSLPPRPTGLLPKGLVLHHRGGEGMEGFSGSVKNGDSVMQWRNLQSGTGDAAFTAHARQLSKAPRYFLENVKGLKVPVGMLRFAQGQGMSLHLPKSSSSHAAYPFGSKTSKRGVTVAAVVRPAPKDREVSLIRITDEDGKSVLVVRALPNNEFRIIIRADGQTKDAKITGRNSKVFSVVSVVWDGTTHKAVLNIRAQDGGKSRVEMAAPKLSKPLVLNKFRISDEAEGSRTVTPESAFLGDVVEFVVWPYPMDWEERNLMDWNLASHYFETPGTRY